MFQVINETAFNKYHFLELDSVYRHDDHWKCETKCGKYLQIRLKYSIIHMSLGDTELELNQEDIVLKLTGKRLVDNLIDFDINKLNILEDMMSVDFIKIKDFMGWTCPEEQVWDS